MRTFYEFLSDLDILSRLWLIETYFTFDPAQYNRLFDDELRNGGGLGNGRDFGLLWAVLRS